MSEKLSESDIYTAMLNYARDNELLIYSNTTTYFAIALPLIGVSFGAGDLSTIVKIVAALSGLMLSVIWFLVIERTRRWFTYILSETEKMERSSGFYNGRSTLYQRLPKSDWFIKHTPRSSRIFTFIYTLGSITFLTLLIYHVLELRH